MTGILSKEEHLLLDLLCAAFGKKNMAGIDMDCNWEQLLQLAEAHAVSAMLYDVLDRETELAANVMARVKKDAQAIVLANYRLLFLTAYLTEYLGKQGILAITLKGAATASLYPVPEYRKSGDVDLLVPQEADYKRALDLLQLAGFQTVKNQTALHHVELRNAEGISVELHHTLTEAFESKKLNDYLLKIVPEYAKHAVDHMDWGIRLLQPSDAYHAFYLIIHMLQHFIREGFGLKNLCDWTLFWDRNIAETEKNCFLKLVEESGTGQFVRVLTASCVQYCELSKEKVAFLLTEPIKEELVSAFMRDVLDAGEFGWSEADRMVTMRGTGFMAYLQEFHHQMHVNYPRAGKIVLFWPLLWGLTLARFLYNNRRLHRASVCSILKKAGYRSELIKQLRLFE